MHILKHTPHICSMCLIGALKGKTVPKNVDIDRIWN